MKKRMLALLLTVMMVTALFTGCGASSGVYDNAMMKQEAAVEAPASGEMMGGVSNSVTDSVSTDQKLIKRVFMETETEDLEALLPVIAAKITELGGYVERQELYNGGFTAALICIILVPELERFAKTKDEKKALKAEKVK